MTETGSVIDAGSQEIQQARASRISCVAAAWHFAASVVGSEAKYRSAYFWAANVVRETSADADGPLALAARQRIGQRTEISFRSPDDRFYCENARVTGTVRCADEARLLEPPYPLPLALSVRARQRAVHGTVDGLSTCAALLLGSHVAGQRSPFVPNPERSARTLPKMPFQWPCS